MFHPCVVIPIYNNKDTIEGVVARMLPLDLPFLIINDGSNAATRAVLDRLAGAQESVTVEHLAQNGGKGQAVKAGLRLAKAKGYSHAVMVDADGQHTEADASKFLEAAQANPEALILGAPVFGPDVPKARLYGRELSKFFVRIETLSFAIHDPLFGFRLYPVAASCAVLDESNIGERMDFDPEIAVRIVWRGAPVVNIPSRVNYPEGGVSHFRMVRDNIRITWMHTRLCIGMVFRSPWLLGRRLRKRG